MWAIDDDEDYFRILDKNKNTAAYFDPDYGNIYPKDKEYEIIQSMLKNHDKIHGGYLMLPMVKFGLFDQDLDTDIEYLQSKIESALSRVNAWYSFLSSLTDKRHSIRISHTDQDMLSITIPIKFERPTPLHKKELLESLRPILDEMQKQGLL